MTINYNIHFGPEPRSLRRAHAQTQKGGEVELVDGFIDFATRNWSCRGDKGTWARYDAQKGSLVVNRAAHGTLSDAYAQTLREFCAQYGIDFDALHCGERVTVNI